MMIYKDLPRKKTIIISTFIIIIAIAHTSSNTINERPIIAVLAQEAYNSTKESYIAASYIKYLESAGARVVPIPTSYSENEVSEIYEYVNGVFLPGGEVDWDKSPYYRNAVMALEISIQGKLNGYNFFPVWGTCLGFQALFIYVANTPKILSNVPLENGRSLQFTEVAADSRMFKHIPEYLYDALSSTNITYNHHDFGVTMETYYNNENVKDFFKILSTNVDEEGKTFISTTEAYDFPIYGVQWHPEKNNFEFNEKVVAAHDDIAVQVSLYTAAFFIREARKNMNRFPSKKLEKEYLIYNFEPIRTDLDKEYDMFEQIYLFKGKTKDV